MAAPGYVATLTRPSLPHWISGSGSWAAAVGVVGLCATYAAVRGARSVRHGDQFRPMTNDLRRELLHVVSRSQRNNPQTLRQ